MPDKNYIVTIDGHDYNYKGSDKTTDADITSVVSAIRASIPHRQLLAKDQNQQAIKTAADSLGVPLKTGTTPGGKQGLINDTNGESVADYTARKAKQEAQNSQAEYDALKWKNFELEKNASEQFAMNSSPTNARKLTETQKQEAVNAQTMQQLGGDRYDPSRLFAAAINSPTDLFAGKIHDQALAAPPGSHLQLFEPGSDQVIADTPGFLGGLRQVAQGASDPFNLALMLGLPLAGAGALAESGASPLLGGFFSGQMAGGLGEQAGDSQLRASDPGKYWGRLLGTAGLIAAPMAIHAGGEFGKTVRGIGDTLSPGDFANDPGMQAQFDPTFRTPEQLAANDAQLKSIQAPLKIANRTADAANMRGTPPADAPIMDMVRTTTGKGKIAPNVDPMTYDGVPSGNPRTIKQNQNKTGVDLNAVNDALEADALPPVDSLPRTPGFMEDGRQVLDKLRNYFVENLSAMNREAPESHAATVEYASAPVIAQQEGVVRIPEVLKNFETPEESSQFQRYLTADAIDAKRLQLRKALSVVETEGEKNKIIRQMNDLAYQENGGRLIDPVSEQPITKAMLDEYFNRPSVQAAVEAHKAHVEPYLNENFINAGYDTNGTRGLRSDTFTPKLALDENGGDMGQLRGNRLGTDTKVKDVPGANEFTGTAEDYEPDYQTAIQQRFDSGTRAALQRKMIQNWIAEGIGINPAEHPDAFAFLPVERGSSGVKAKLQESAPKIFGSGEDLKPAKKGYENKELTVNYKGVQEPAVSVRLGAGFGWENGSNLDLPREIVMPTRFAKEAESVFQTYNMDRLDRMAKIVNNSFVEANLTGPGDALAHSISLVSRIGNKIPVAQNYLVDGLAKAIPGVKLLFSVEKMFHNAPEERIEAAQYMARSGVLPKDFPVEFDPHASLIGKGKTFLGRALYGENGVLVNAATALYKYAKENADLSTPEGRQLMRDMMGELNSNVKVLRPTLQRLTNAVGLGTFYQTGIKNRTSYYHQPPPALVAGMVGSIVMPVALFRLLDPQHRMPTQVPGYRLGDIPVGKGKDGKDKYFNYLKITDKTASYATFFADSLLKSLANKDTPLHTVENLATDSANQIVSPMFSGPYGGALSVATGIAPHIAPNDTLNGIKFTPNNSVYTPMFSYQRAMLLGQALAPQTAIAGDYGEQVSPTSLTPKDSHGLDIGLKIFGLPPVHNYESPGKILSSNRQKESNTRNVGIRLGNKH